MRAAHNRLARERLVVIVGLFGRGAGGGPLLCVIIGDAPHSSFVREELIDFVNAFGDH